MRPIPAAVRRDVLTRDGERCVLCGRPGPGLHLHHFLHTRGAGGKDVPENLAALCGVCHAEVHQAPERKRALAEVMRRRGITTRVV